MPAEIKWDNDFMEITYTGVLDLTTVKKTINKIFGDPRFEKVRYKINDFSQITEFKFSEEEMKLIANMDRMASSWIHKLTTAYIIHDDLKQFIPLYENFAKIERTVGYFEDYEKAMAWLQEMGYKNNS